MASQRGFCPRARILSIRVSSLTPCCRAARSFQVPVPQAVLQQYRMWYNEYVRLCGQCGRPPVQALSPQHMLSPFAQEQLQRHVQHQLATAAAWGMAPVAAPQPLVYFAAAPPPAAQLAAPVAAYAALPPAAAALQPVNGPGSAGGGGGGSGSKGGSKKGGGKKGKSRALTEDDDEEDGAYEDDEDDDPTFVGGPKWGKWGGGRAGRAALLAGRAAKAEAGEGGGGGAAAGAQGEGAAAAAAEEKRSDYNVAKSLDDLPKQVRVGYRAGVWTRRVSLAFHVQLAEAVAMRVLILLLLLLHGGVHVGAAACVVRGVHRHAVCGRHVHSVPLLALRQGAPGGESRGRPPRAL